MTKKSGRLVGAHGVGVMRVAIRDDPPAVRVAGCPAAAGQTGAPDCGIVGGLWAGYCTYPSARSWFSSISSISRVGASPQGGSSAR